MIKKELKQKCLNAFIHKFKIDLSEHPRVYTFLLNDVENTTVTTVFGTLRYIYENYNRDIIESYLWSESEILDVIKDNFKREVKYLRLKPRITTTYYLNNEPVGQVYENNNMLYLESLANQTTLPIVKSTDISKILTYDKEVKYPNFFTVLYKNKEVGSLKEVKNSKYFNWELKRFKHEDTILNIRANNPTELKNKLLAF